MENLFQKEDHNLFNSNGIQVVKSTNGKFYIRPFNKINFSQSDLMEVKEKAISLGIVFDNSSYIIGYNKKEMGTCANYERDNTLLSEMEQNVAEFISLKNKDKEFTEEQIKKHPFKNVYDQTELVITSPRFNGPYFPCSDPIVESVRKKLLDRSSVGIKKYGEQLGNYSKYNFILEMQNEALDFANYCEVELQKEETINQLVRKYPNDADLGREIRKLYN